MASIVLGCDENNANDADVQNTVASILEKAGHQVEKLDIDPGPFANYSYSSKGEGKIGVYLLAAGITSIADAYDGNISFKYTYFGIRGDLDQERMNSMSDFQNNPISTDWHGDCTSASCSTLAGKTFPQMNEIIKSKCQITFGTNGQELGNNLVKLIGGKTDNTSSAESTGSTIKEALKKAVSGWDGEAEIRLVNDTVYVNKIKDPTTTKLVLNEFENAIYDNITVTDVNPGTVNHVTCTFKDNVLSIQDDILIKRFGKISQQVTCDESIKTLDEAKSFLQREFNKIRRDDGRQVEAKITPGSTKWKTGLWVRVYLPSYFIDDYMYISKASHDEDGSSNWTSSITLVDYPPSFGTYEEEEELTEDETDETVTTGTEEEAT